MRSKRGQPSDLNIEWVDEPRCGGHRTRQFFGFGEYESCESLSTHKSKSARQLGKLCLQTGFEFGWSHKQKNQLVFAGCRGVVLRLDSLN